MVAEVILYEYTSEARTLTWEKADLYNFHLTHGIAHTQHMKLLLQTITYTIHTHTYTKHSIQHKAHNTNGQTHKHTNTHCIIYTSLISHDFISINKL